MYSEKHIVYETPVAWVLNDVTRKAYTVFLKGVTASESDSSYALTEDGLSLAKARTDYLTKRKAR